MLRDPSSVSRPAITRVSLSRRLTSVSARRFVSPGTSLTVTSKLIEEISVAMRAAITPDSLATGETSNLMPYSLKATEALPSAPDTGIGNSPPATNRALPPDRHDRRGSARMAASPDCTRKFSRDAIAEAIDRLLASGQIRFRTSIAVPSASPPGRNSGLR